MHTINSFHHQHWHHHETLWFTFWGPRPAKYTKVINFYEISAICTAGRQPQLPHPSVRPSVHLCVYHHNHHCLLGLNSCVFGIITIFADIHKNVTFICTSSQKTKNRIHLLAVNKMNFFCEASSYQTRNRFCN